MLAIGTASAAAFGPEFVKSLVTGSTDAWWFLGLFGAAVGIILAALWWRQRLRDLDVATVVAAAIDPHLEAAGLSLHNSAQAYAAGISPAPVMPYLVPLPADRAAAATQADKLGDRVNEFISIAQAVAPSARRINLVLTARNAAAFRIGQRITKNHRKQIVIHHGDANGFFPALRLVAHHGHSRRCECRRHTIDGGAPDRGAVLVHVGAVDDGALDRAKSACADAGAGFLVEVHYPHNRLPADRGTFEGLVAEVVAGWAEHRAEGTRGPTPVMLRCPAVIALALGVELAAHPDAPWIPYEFTDGRYVAFTPG